MVPRVSICSDGEMVANSPSASRNEFYRLGGETLASLSRSTPGTWSVESIGPCRWGSSTTGTYQYHRPVPLCGCEGHGLAGEQARTIHALPVFTWPELLFWQRQKQGQCPAVGSFAAP